jgi:hypothetical protein
LILSSAGSIDQTTIIILMIKRIHQINVWFTFISIINEVVFDSEKGLQSLIFLSFEVRT